ncbi:phenylacetic acid degradation bifunctional protein PaaZ [Notoacmeibacter ruber]|uniref:Phenylacetic acid degradation bifunctional protein PaaZ n=1 Tax=Notoacmeibacter ruber TaxID=2670375 RepID=A0A3L7JDK1_9HYPH|nr:phenylacetic acid degradation bifunctional protein PaaZ [Notoacmeibacter ruber]RLQ88399.1 phenylacetic acid degradation bifunctional protein PaaZ [Notoacmeibacter ruber]
MSIMELRSFVAGEWHGADGSARDIRSAVTGEVIARAGAKLDYQAMLDEGRERGSPSLRAMTFHERAAALKALALYLSERKDRLYDLSLLAGSTRGDAMIDVDGGIGTLFALSSKARRTLPDDVVLPDGELEMLSRDGTFLGHHIYTSRQGVAVHINAFNFPVWGMLEKLAPTLLGGMSAIVKPATATAYITEACFQMMIECGAFPDGSFQLITGGTGDLLDRLDASDLVSFTGSAETALMLRSNSNLMARSVPFIAEQDSLNASVLGPDVTTDALEFDLFVKEVVREMTAKAGQKCTAIRRVIAPAGMVDPLVDAISAKLSKIAIGDPALEGVRMGALASADQKKDVLEKAAMIGSEAKRVFGTDDPELHGDGVENGAFVSPMLYRCDSPDAANKVHEAEAFGPVSTIMPYRDLDHAVSLMNRGKGSLVASLITHDPTVARRVAIGAGAWHGRLYMNDRDSMKASTGHGSPLPLLVHGGPGRAGGGEELGGMRGVKHYMQRTAVQGSPDMIAAVTGQYVPGAAKTDADVHPFAKKFEDLRIGESITAGPRTITKEDVEHFAEFTGDTFYAHMNEEAAKASPFFDGRVAHGYLLLAFAAGLFVHPDPGPTLANTGLSDLRFTKPVYFGEAISVSLTVKEKRPTGKGYGEVLWHVGITDSEGDQVAGYTLHTMNASRED